jgi:hypothetical protein
VSFHGSARHIQLAGDLRVVTSLQQQLDDLLFARAQPNGLFVVHIPPSFGIASRPNTGAPSSSTEIHSIHDAILRRSLL